MYGGIQGTAQGSKSVRGTFVIRNNTTCTTGTDHTHMFKACILYTKIANRMKKIVGLQLLNQFSVDYRLLSTTVVHVGEINSPLKFPGTFLHAI